MLLDIIKRDIGKWVADTHLAKVIYDNLRRSYENQTMTVFDVIIRATQGITQGSVISPELFKWYMDALTTDDTILNKLKVHLRKWKTEWMENGDTWLMQDL